MEERLAAVAGLGASLVERAQDDLDLESVHVLHLGGQRRQLFLVPIQGGFTLVALADADANPADISRLLLATARDLLTLPETVEDDEDRRRVRRHRAELGRPDHQR
jgi:predicted regulator of Ras-like GTPase activity (Roadblock/LC7/MglB family)